VSDGRDLQCRGTSKYVLALVLVRASEGVGGGYLLSGYARVSDDLKGVCSPFLCGLLSSGGPCPCGERNGSKGCD
jgi:hypothetical protein